MAHGEFAALENLADDVDGGVVFVFFGDKGNLRARDDQRNGKVIVGIILTEIRRAGVKRNVHLRKLRRQFVLKLLLAVGFVQMLEIAIRVISGPVVKLQIRAVHLNFQMAVSPVLCRVVADETQNVVRRSVLLDLRKDSAEVVRIKKGLAASVGGKRRERFLGGGVVVQIVQYGLPGIGGLPVQARRLRLAARGKCLQAAEVHRIDGHVRLDRRGGGGAQSRLIVRAGLADAVAEADEAFLLREFAEPLHDGFERQQFSVGAKGVVVGIIRRERTAGFRRSFGAAGAAVVKSLAFAGGVGGKSRQQLSLVVGKIQIDAQIRGQGHQGDQVRRLHLGGNEALGRVDGAIDLLRIHGRKVEEEEH